MLFRLGFLFSVPGKLVMRRILVTLIASVALSVLVGCSDSKSPSNPVAPPTPENSGEDVKASKGRIPPLPGK